MKTKEKLQKHLQNLSRPDRNLSDGEFYEKQLLEAVIGKCSDNTDLLFIAQGARNLINQIHLTLKS